MLIARKLCCSIVLIIGSIVMLSAQNVKVPQNALLNHLLRDTNTVSWITLSMDPIIPLPSPFDKNFQQLIKSKSALYIFIDGTGRIYKASSWDNNWVNFDRVDSTTYFGFNKGSHKFITGDTIFSFGGYGFWHFNGSLSYFTHRKEWEMLQLNKEIPYYEIYDRISSISQYDAQEKKFYFSPIPIGQQTVINDIVNDSFYVFDIHKRDVKAIGKLAFSNTDFIRYSESRRVETPWGILFDSPFEYNSDFLLNIKDNLMYASENRIIQQLIPSSAYTNTNLLFYQNGYLFASSYPFTKIDSLKFDVGKFKLLKTKIYTTSLDGNEFSFLFYLKKFDYYILCVIICILLVFVFYLYRTRNSSAKSESVLEHAKGTEILTTLEKQLLKQFVNKIEKNDCCSTEELNTLLGVALKSTEIKKKARTDFITKVNYKLKQHFSMSDDVIVRNRSEEDKRSYLYSISKELISEVKNLID